VENSHLKGLLEAMLDDPDVAARYRRAPAAKSIHHAYLGGLLEHVLSLCTLARVAASHYSFVDYDLLIAGVVLHDIGKIYELNYDRGFSYSDEGQLLGHIHIALRMVGDKLRGLPDFPPLLRTLVEHMILSHHGQLEFGSPKQPQFPEALLLHYLDDMDSKMECMRELVEKDRLVEGCFTSFHNALGRVALKKERFLNPPAAAPRPPAKPELEEAPRANGVAPGPVAAPKPPGKPELDEAPRPPAAVAPPSAASHPLFAPRPEVAPGDKLQPVLQPAGAKQEN